MVDRISDELTKLAFRRPVLVVALASAMALLSAGVSARRLSWNANPDELASRGAPYLVDYEKYKAEFGDLDCAYVVVAANGERRRAEACVDRLCGELRRLEGIDGVYASIAAEEQLRVATRAMPLEDLERLRNSMGAFAPILSGSGPGEVLKEARRMLSDLTRLGLVLSNEQQTQLGSSAMFLLNSVAGAMEDSEARASMSPLLRDEADREYLRSDGGGLYFLRLLMHKDYATLDVVAAPLARVRDAIAKVQKEFPGLEIGLTGKQVLLCDQMRVASRDMAFATGLSVLLVYLAFTVTLRGVVRPAMAIYCLGLGTCWTYGLTTLAVGELTLISAAFTPILVGIGIEFGVHVLTRYQEERRACAAELAMRRALAAVGRGNLTSAGATCAAFLTATLTNSPGFSQLGLIAGAGVVFCMIALTVVLPAMVVLYERWSGGHLESKTLSQLEIRLPKRPLGRRALAACAAAAVVCAAFATRVRFEDNVLELQPPRMDSVVWEKRVLQESGSTLFASVVVDDLEQVASKAARVQGLASVAKVHSVLDAIAPPSDKRSRLCAEVASFELPPPAEPAPDWDPTLLSSVARTLSTLTPLARVRSPRDADRMARLAEDLVRLEERLTDPDPAAAGRARADVERYVQRVAGSLRWILEGNRLPLREALPESVRALLMSPRGKFLVMAHPRENVWDFPALERFVRDLRGVDPHATGFPVTHLGTVHDLKWSFYVAAALSLGAVAALVWIDLRSLRETVLATLPLVVGLTWTLGAMGMAGWNLNLVNFIAVPLLVGISVDSGVHILHRLREGAPGGAELGTTTSAVVLTSLTSMFGFGSLMSSSHRGAQSLGAIMTVGCALILLASLTLLPALASLWREGRSGRGREEEAPVVRIRRRRQAG